ncbi:hypothetical protein [Chryseobacterium sp. SIMBA_028]|uniref:hypothetical protein n=1 Tax=Chryseobacterium sp. SIMBA_028 TaxID=3085771 RepID=UPI00397B0202
MIYLYPALIPSVEVILFPDKVPVYDIPPIAPPRKFPPENAEFKPPETIPGRKLLMAPALLAIFPNAPEMAAPPVAPPTTALHVFYQSHF